MGSFVSANVSGNTRGHTRKCGVRFDKPLSGSEVNESGVPHRLAPLRLVGSEIISGRPPPLTSLLPSPRSVTVGRPSPERHRPGGRELPRRRRRRVRRPPPDVPVDEAAHGALAVAAGEAPPAAVPSLGVRAKVEAVTGTYEGYRGAVTATVEGEDGRLAVSVEPWGVAFPAFPESSDPDDHSFYTVQHHGHRVPVEFREYDSGVALLWSLARLDRTGG